MPTLTRSLTAAGLIALLAVVCTLPGVGVAQRERLAPTACTVALRTAANDATPAAATPVPVTSNSSNLPPGEQADPETVAQVTAAVQELAGCLNAADPSRLTAMLTDAAIATGIDRDDFTPVFVGAGTLDPGSGGVPWEIVWLRARNVQVLPDGRVSADVAWGVTDDPELKPIPESTVHVYARVGDRWLLDAMVRGNVANQQGVGSPGGDDPAGSDIDPILRRATQGFNEVDSALYAEPTMAGAKFSIQAMLMVGFVGNDEYGGVGCEMFIFERGEASATVSAYCRAEEALIGRAAYLHAEVSGPHRGSTDAPSRCEDVALLAASMVFSCTVDLPKDSP
jgi:hypothetical protein